VVSSEIILYRWLGLVVGLGFILYTWDLYCNISKYYKGHTIIVDVQIENHAPTYVTVEKFYPVFNMTITFPYQSHMDYPEH